MSALSKGHLLWTVLLCMLSPSVFGQSSLQRLLDETKDGDTVYIEKNTYESDNSITLDGRKNLCLIFEKGTTVTCTSQFQDIFILQNCQNISLFNGCFMHVVANDQTPFGSGFYLYRSKDIRMVHSTIDNHGLRGIYAHATSGIEVTDSKIGNNSASAFLWVEQNENVRLTGNRYEANGRDGNLLSEFNPNPPEPNAVASILERTLNQEEKDSIETFLQNQDAVFGVIRKMRQSANVLGFSEDSLRRFPFDPEQIDKTLVPSQLKRGPWTAQSVFYLKVPESVSRYIAQNVGLNRFDTQAAYEFFRYDEPDFTGISPKNFLDGIRSGFVILSDGKKSRIRWNCDPELGKSVEELKTKSDQQIASVQENIQYRLLQVWEKYQTAGLLFNQFRFCLPGTALLKRSSYRVDTQILEVPLYLSCSDAADKDDSLYVCTLRILIQAEECRRLFFHRNECSLGFTLQFHPGYNLAQAVSDANVSFPNMESLAEITFEDVNLLGNHFTFQSEGLKGPIGSKTNPSKERFKTGQLRCSRIAPDSTLPAKNSTSAGQ